MSIHWDSLLAVFVVSLGSAVAVVVLVALAMLGLSARVPSCPTGLGRRCRPGAPAWPGRPRPVPAWRWPQRSC